MYSDEKWCGFMNKTKGPWSDCIKIDKDNYIDDLVVGCIFDMCAYEDKPEIQKELRCNSYKKASDKCYELADRLGIDIDIDWREEAKCGMHFIFIKLSFTHKLNRIFLLIKIYLNYIFKFRLSLIQNFKYNIKNYFIRI